MTREWRTAPTALQCGHCGAAIAAGAVFRAIGVPGVSRRLVRCHACAEREPAPGVASQADWKARAAGEDR